MKQKKCYKYIGRNGLLTTNILLEGINNIPLMELIADEGKVLTDGERQVHTIAVELDEVDNWKEIADENN